MTEVKQIPNLQDDVRFVSTLPGRVAEEIQQRGPALRGWTQKAAGLPCKQADSERYRASPRK